MASRSLSSRPAEFKTSLVHRVSSRSVRVTQRNPAGGAQVALVGVLTDGTVTREQVKCLPTGLIS